MTDDTTIHARMRQAWRQVLGDSIEIRDALSLFEHGGTSVQALQLFLEVKRGFPGIDVSLSDLLREPTVLGMVHALQGERPADLIEYHEGADSWPMFVLAPPAGSGPEAYAGIIQRLDRAIPIVGLKTPCSRSAEGPGTLSGVCGAYAASLLARYGVKRPFHLLGWSLGGLIAVEVACQLRRAQAQVGTLFLIDSALSTTAQAHYLANLGTAQRNAMVTEDLQHRGLDAPAIAQILRSRDLEEALFTSKPSARLDGCRMVLFKAGERDPRCRSGLEQRLHDLADRNDSILDLVAQADATIVRIDQRHHNDILEESEIIVKYIQQYIVASEGV